MAKSLPNSDAFPGIDLTVLPGTADHPPGGTVRVPASHFIAYHGEAGFTRLILVGHQSPDVKETTEQIDRIIRSAAEGHQHRSHLRAP